MLHLKDLVRTLMERKGSLKGLDIVSLAAEPWFVPDTTTLEEQLNAFRERREHFALRRRRVRRAPGPGHARGHPRGGLRQDRRRPTAAPEEHIRPQADGSFNVDGLMPIRELNRQLNWTLPDDAATTIAGLVLNEARVIPDVGQVFSFYGFKFEILRRQRNQITALRIVPPPPEPEDAGRRSGRVASSDAAASLAA